MEQQNNYLTVCVQLIGFEETALLGCSRHTMQRVNLKIDSHQSSWFSGQAVAQEDGDLVQ